MPVLQELVIDARDYPCHIVVASVSGVVHAQLQAEADPIGARFNGYGGTAYIAICRALDLRAQVMGLDADGPQGTQMDAEAAYNLSQD